MSCRSMYFVSFLYNTKNGKNHLYKIAFCLQKKILNKAEKSNFVKIQKVNFSSKFQFVKFFLFRRVNRKKNNKLKNSLFTNILDLFLVAFKFLFTLMSHVLEHLLKSGAGFLPLGGLARNAIKELQNMCSFACLCRKILQNCVNRPRADPSANCAGSGAAAGAASAAVGRGA